MNYDPNKTTWLNPDIEYLIGNEIYEYDMKDAGFSLIKQFKLLSDTKIAELSKLDKGLQRHIAVGKLQGEDRSFSEALTSKFAEMRRVFVNENNLSGNDIISVKKDAIFVIGTCEKLKFGQVEFIPKNQYTSYIRFHNANDIEVYYSEDQIDIKGMGDSAVNKHRLYMIEFLKKIIDMMESKDQKVKRYIMKFIIDYKARELDEEYYIKFDRRSSEMDLLYNYQNIIIPLIYVMMRELS